MRQNYSLNDSNIIAACIFLSVVFFTIDLAVIWAIGSVLYVIVIIVALQSENPKIAYISSLAVSLLTIAGLLISPPATEVIRVFTNHFLVLLIIWIATFLGIQNKRQYTQRAYLAAIVDFSGDIIIGKSLTGRIRSWNKTAEKTYGYRAQEAVGCSINILIPPGKITEEEDLLARIRNGEEINHYETIRQRKDGKLLNVSLTLSPIKSSSGQVIGISSIARNITEKKQAEKEERELKEKVELEKMKLEQVLSFEEGLNTIFNIDKLIDFVVLKTSQVLEAQRCSLMFFDAGAKELRIKGQIGLTEEIVKNSRLKLGEPIAGMVAQENKPLLVTDIETDEYLKRGKRPPYKSKSFISAPIQLNGQLMGVINVADKTGAGGVFTDIDLKILCMIVRQTAIAIENARLYRELTHLAVTDPLTNLNNYRYFTKALDQEINRAQRYGSPLCLLMLDLNNFKEYNDSFGHLEGDQLLREVADVLNKNIRSIDIACRYAGDEFVVILPETRLEQTKSIVRKLHERLGALQLKRPLSASIGVAAYHKDMDRHDLILRADMRLYEAKRQHRTFGYS